MATYPAAVASFGAFPSTLAGSSGSDHEQRHDAAEDEIVAIQTELGTSPSSTYATVSARLDAMARGLNASPQPTAFSNQTGISSTATVVTGTSVTLTAGQVYTLVLVKAIIQQVTSAGTVELGLYRNGTKVETLFRRNLAAGDEATVSGWAPEVIVPGTSYTYDVRASTTAGTVSVLNATNPVSIMFLGVGAPP